MSETEGPTPTSTPTTWTWAPTVVGVPSPFNAESESEDEDDEDMDEDYDYDGEDDEFYAAYADDDEMQELIDELEEEIERLEEKEGDNDDSLEDMIDQLEEEIELLQEQNEQDIMDLMDDLDDLPEEETTDAPIAATITEYPTYNPSAMVTEEATTVEPTYYPSAMVTDPIVTEVPTFFPSSWVTDEEDREEKKDEPVGILPMDTAPPIIEPTFNGNDGSTTVVSSAASSLTADEIKYAAIGGGIAAVLLIFIGCCIYMKCFRVKSGKSAQRTVAEEERDSLNVHNNDNESDGFHDEDVSGGLDPSTGSPPPSSVFSDNLPESTGLVHGQPRNVV